MIKLFDEILEKGISPTKLVMYDYLIGLPDYFELTEEEQEKVLNHIYNTYLEWTSMDINECLDFASNYIKDIVKFDDFDLSSMVC